MARNIFLPGFDGSNHYVNSVSIAQKIMQTAFRWLKILCEQRFDGSKYYVNSVSIAQNIVWTAFDGSKHYVNSV